MNPIEQHQRMAIRRLPLCFLVLVALCALLTLPCSAASFNIGSLNLVPSAADRAAASDSRLTTAVDEFKTSKPDVILLQGVRDWKMCSQIATMLKPVEYQVIVCSSFRDPFLNGPSASQTAILAKDRALFTWSEPWQNAKLPGGFAFAALTIGNQRIGCLSVMLDTPLAAESDGTASDLHANAVTQMLAQIGSVRKWSKNRPDLFLLGGSVRAEREQVTKLLSESGFTVSDQDDDTSLLMVAGGQWQVTLRAADQAATGSKLWAVNTTRRPATAANAPKPPVTPAPQPKAEPVQPPAPSGESKAASTASPTVALEDKQPVLKLPQPIPAGPKTDRAEQRKTDSAISATATSSLPTQLSTPPSQIATTPAPGSLVPAQVRQNLWLIVALAIVTILLLILTLRALFRRGRERQAPLLLMPGGQSVDQFNNHNYVVVGQEPKARMPDSTTPTITHTNYSLQEQRFAEDPTLRRTIAAWLKQKLVRKLIEDRGNLIQGQQEAAQKAMGVTARLARIERQIEEQNNMYQVRIDALTSELEASREESRALLRARIAQVKSEMEAAKARLLASTDEE